LFNFNFNMFCYVTNQKSLLIVLCFLSVPRWVPRAESDAASMVHHPERARRQGLYEYNCVRHSPSHFQPDDIVTRAAAWNTGACFLWPKPQTTTTTRWRKKTEQMQQWRRRTRESKSEWMDLVTACDATRRPRDDQWIASASPPTRQTSKQLPPTRWQIVFSHT
jgi:hypothetical protein